MRLFPGRSALGRISGEGNISIPRGRRRNFINTAGKKDFSALRCTFMERNL
jgi:hypothetical protein